MLKIGVTGGIGSGKTIVCKVFEQLGIPVFNADINAEQIINQDIGIREKFLKHFGNQIYEGDIINKKILASIIFSNIEARLKVNSIVHPVLKEYFEEWLEQYRAKKYVIKEAALLFEAGTYQDLDEIITVFAPEELRISRVIQRDNTTIEETKTRINSQLDENIKLNKADYIIYNDEDQLIIPQILKLHNKFSQ